MPLTLPRATFFFQDGKYGWSETHWNANAGTITYQQLQLQAIALADLRIGLLGGGPLLSVIRVSDDAIRRDSYIVLYNKGAANVASKLSLDGVGADVPYSVVLIRGQSGALYRRMFFLSGVPDADIVDVPTQKVVIAGVLLDNFNAWIEELKLLWGFKGYKHPPDQTPFPIIGFSNIGPLWTVTTAAPHGLIHGDPFFIDRTTPNKGISGRWIATSTTADTVTFQGTGSSPVWETGGQVYKAVQQIFPYTDVIVRGVTHRKRGRPFDSPVGRARRRT